MHIPIHTTDQAYYVAFHIERILMVKALGEYKQLYAKAPEYQSEITIVQHSELVSSLLQSVDERFTYELRIVSQPNVDQPSQGRIQVYCIVAMRAIAAETAQTNAQRIYQLFNAHFRDVVWVAVADVAALLTLPEVRHAVSLTRKSGFILSDRSESIHPYGFGPRTSTLARSQQQTNERMFFVSPFVASGRQAHTLFDYMLQHPFPVTLSIRLQRTQLTAEEVRFCQENLDTYSANNRYPQAVAAQLAHYQHIMNGALLRSYTLAALLNIDIVSPAFIPAPLITLLGNLITQPTGGHGGNNDVMQYHGGYDVISHSDYLPVATAIARVQMRPIPATLTPAMQRLVHLVDVNEAAVAFHIPRSSLSPIPGMMMQSHRQLRPPSDLSDTGTVIGEYVEYGVTKAIHISETDRTRHTYIVGQTGTGKSTVLKSMVLDDIAKGRGVCVIDPHGDLFNDILAQIPIERRDDVIVVDPSQTEAPVGLNLFEYDNQEEREMAVQLFQKTIELLEQSRQTDSDYLGPVFWQHLRNNAYWVTQDKDDPGTIIELYNIFSIPNYYKRWQPINPHDDKLVSWQHVLATTKYNKADADGMSNSGYFNSKFEDFIFDTRLRLIFGQKISTFNFFDAMNSQKIVLVNLSRGLLSEIASAFMGGVILAKLQQAALKRAQMATSQRTIFSIYVDEFQNYTSESFVSLLSESRKYGIALTLANQFLTQIENPRIINAIMGNVGTIVAFRVGITDAEILHPRFTPEVTPNDLINLPNWTAYVSTQVRGQSRRPFSLQTMRPRETLDLRNQAAVIAQSKHRYGRLRSEVERTLTQSMAITRVAIKRNKAVKYDIEVQAYPVLHEKITSSDQDFEMLAVHGAGLSLWNTQQRSFVPLIVGLHAQLFQQLCDTPLTTIQPIQNTQEKDYQEFESWLKQYAVTTLHPMLGLLAYQQTANQYASQMKYACQLLAYQSHHGRPAWAWRDVVLTKGLAVAHDDQHRAWVWHNRPPVAAHIILDIVAIAGCKHYAFLLKNDGTVLQCTPTESAGVPVMANIAQLYGGENFVVGVDTQGKMHISYEYDRFANSVGTIPAHSNIQLVACGFDYVIAYDALQRFVTWGSNDHHCREIPPELMSRKVVALAAGYDRSFALDAQGRLYAWGYHELTSDTIQHLNRHTVRTIACYGKHFLCQTADGTWWHNNQQLNIPVTLLPQYIERIVGNYNGDWLAIRTNDPLIALFQLKEVQISACAELDNALKQVLSDAQITTLSELFQHTHTQLAQMPYFVVRSDALAVLIAYGQRVLMERQLPLIWPEQVLELDTIAPKPSRFGWYARQQTDAKSARYSSYHAQSDFDDFFDDL